MTVSVRTRFEVFKRDRFTCAYCGRTPPEVLLECDHVVPKAAGGSDEMHNLITACATCNSGKAARLLEEGTAPVVGKATVDELAERVEQAKAYMEILGQTSAIAQNQVGMVIDHWAKLFGAERKEDADGHYWTLEKGWGERWPKESSIRRLLRRLTLEDLLAAVEIAAEKMNGEPSQNATRYFYGVCNRAIREGRRVGTRTWAQPTDDVPDEVIEEWFNRGVAVENERIRKYLFSYAENGFDNVWDAIRAVWPEWDE